MGEGWMMTLFWTADTVKEVSPNENSELADGEVAAISSLEEIDF